MSERISQTSHGDAPLSAARNPDIDRSDELVGRSVTINRPRAEVYSYWRNFANLVHVMENIDEIQVVDDRHSHWIVKAPAGKNVEWDSAIVEDIPNELIAWESQPGADVQNSGRVEFKDAPGNRGTLVTAIIVYEPPGGTLGKLIAKLFQREPQIQARRDLRRLKQLLETGEVATSAMNATASAGTKH